MVNSTPEWPDVTGMLPDCDQDYRRSARKPVAVRLTEILLGLTLLMLTFSLLFSLLPSHRAAQVKGGELVAATAFANGWIQEAATYRPDLADREERVLCGGRWYAARRQFVPVPGQSDLLDVVVTMTPSRGNPVRLATRLAR